MRLGSRNVDRARTGRQRGVEARHRSLRATVEWSYRLLPPELQRFFARLSVFRGGCTMEAAERVCGDEDLSFTCPDFLAQLRDSSLIVAEESGGTMRFRMLETLREFGQEQMSASERAEVSRVHTAYFLGLAEEAEPHLYGAGQVEWLQRLESERDNLRTALAWSLQESDPAATELGLRLAGTLEWWWRLRGPWAEGWDFLQRLLARPGAQPRTSIRAKSLYVAAVLSERYDRGRSLAYCEESLQIYRELGDASGASRALGHLGLLAKRQVDLARAEACFEEALTLGRESGDRWAMADALLGLGNTARYRNDHTAAKVFLEQGLAIGREMENRWGIAVALDSLRNVVHVHNDHVAAKALLEESLMFKRELGDVLGVAGTLYALGISTHFLGDAAAAKALIEESLAIHREAGDLRGTADVLFSLGSLAAKEGDYEMATAHGEQSLAIFQESSHIKHMTLVLRSLGEWASACSDNEAAMGYCERNLAIYRDFGDKSGAGQLLNQLGQLAQLQGDLVRAQSCFEEALALGREVGNSIWVAHSLAGLGSVAVAHADAKSAQQYYRESLETYQVFGDRVWTAHVLEEIAVAQGATGQTVRLLSAADRLLEAEREVRLPRLQAVFARATADARETLGEAAWAAAWEEGRAMTLEAAVAEALDVLADSGSW